MECQFIFEGFYFLNHKRIIIIKLKNLKVNRHEHDPTTGRKVSHEVIIQGN